MAKSVRKLVRTRRIIRLINICPPEPCTVHREHILEEEKHAMAFTKAVASPEDSRETIMKHPLFAAIGLLVLSACTAMPDDENLQEEDSSSSIMEEEGLDGTYTDPDGRYSIRYPANWQVQQEQTLNTDTAEYTGTAFTVPADVWEGTIILDARIHLAVEPSCPTMANTESVDIGTRSFQSGSWIGAAAGNRYVGNSLMLTEGEQCFILTLYRQYCNLGENCGEGSGNEPVHEAALHDIHQEMAENLTSKAGSPVACTLEAKLCPDGSYVGRQPPNCEFAPCPGETHVE